MDPQQGAQPDLIIGQTIGNYLVTQKLGEGGMGAVYLAEHPSIGKKVALKVLHSEFSSNQDVAARFFNEAKAVNDIGHPNIVDIVDFGIIQAGVGREQLVYFIMEYLGGMSLSKLLRTESPLAPERALTIALQVADALAASHRCGIVHRDLKPDNIMLVSRGRERDFVKLLDFGIAKLTGDSHGSRRTRTGIVMGTPAYMSPEQCEGRGNIDHRTDVYALGIVVYEMLVGRVPFIGEGYGEVLVQHLTQPPLPPSQFRMMNPHLEAVVMKALEKRADARYPTMDEMMRAFSDPVGYVESNGGLAGFAQRQLMPSNAPLPPVRLTPAPVAGVTGMMGTPVPGSLPTPGLGLAVPGHATPTTLGGATGEVEKKRGKAGFVIGGIVVAAAAAVGIAVVAGGGSKDDAGSDQASGGTPADAALVAVADAAEVKAPPPDAAEVKPAVGSGSETGSGSAQTVEKPKVATITLSTKPAGAKIFVNGFEVPQRTPAPFELPLSDTAVAVVLRLEGYKDIPLTIVPNQNFVKDETFKKARVGGVVGPVGKGSGSAGTGTGKGSGSGQGKGSGNDTGLMRPGD